MTLCAEVCTCVIPLLQHNVLKRSGASQVAVQVAVDGRLMAWLKGTYAQMKERTKLEDTLGAF